MEKKELKNRLLPIILTLAVIILDQISKALVVKNIPLLDYYDESCIVNVLGDFLRFIHVRNPAIAFSIGQGLPLIARKILFSAVPIVVIALIFVVYFRSNEFTQIQRWCICSILGGGIGNIIDRVFRPNGVVDFIDVKWFGISNSPFKFLRWQRWPTFNVADMAVVIGGVIFIISFIVILSRDSKKEKKSENKDKKSKK